MTNKVQYFEKNVSGRDYVTGDIHGCLEDLLLALKAIKFDENVDRLFSVGDLIDRGPNSYECAQLVDKPWFHATKGNHEDMMIASVLRNDGHMTKMWLSNGGQWIYQTGTWQQKYVNGELEALATKLNELPLVIVVGKGANRFNIVHAEFYRVGAAPLGFQPTLLNISNSDIDNWTFTPKEEERMLWGRNLIRTTTFDPNPQLYLSPTFVGHTPLSRMLRCFQHYYIDTACVYHYVGTQKDTQALSFACPQERVVYSWSPAWKKLTSTPFAEIPMTESLINTAPKTPN